MVYVIAEPCIGKKDMSCIAVCPADCIKEGTVENDGQLYEMAFIDPNSCIGCGLCSIECPVGAIFSSEAVPVRWEGYARINAQFHGRDRSSG